MAEADISYRDEFDAILGEVIRHAQMDWRELAARTREIGFYDLTDRAGRRRPIGRSAHERLWALVEDSLARSVFHRRIDPERTFRHAAEQFGKTFLHRGLVVPDEPALRGLFAAWIEQAGAECGRRTEFIPCHVELSGVDELAIGPVVIRPRAQAHARLRTLLDDHLTQHGETERVDSREEVEVYFGSFSDMAEVTVPGCDRKMARVVAEQVVQSALDFLHAWAGATHTRRMRGGGHGLAADKRASLSTNAAGRTEIGYEISWHGANVSDEAWVGLQTESAALTGPVGVALTAVLERRNPELLADRFLDACGWYGDAAREPSPAAAAVKFVTAMERLLWTGEDRGVTQRIADRAAALCFSIETWDLHQQMAEIKDAYDLRSALLHGRISKADPVVQKRVRRCERAARELLLTWLERFGDGFDKPIKVKALGRYLDGFVAAAKADCAEQLRLRTADPDTSPTA